MFLQDWLSYRRHDLQLPSSYSAVACRSLLSDELVPIFDAAVWNATGIANSTVHGPPIDTDAKQDEPVKQHREPYASDWSDREQGSRDSKWHESSSSSSKGKKWRSRSRTRHSGIEGFSEKHCWLVEKYDLDKQAIKMLRQMPFDDMSDLMDKLNKKLVEGEYLNNSSAFVVQCAKNAMAKSERSKH